MRDLHGRSIITKSDRRLAPRGAKRRKGSERACGGAGKEISKIRLQQSEKVHQGPHQNAQRHFRQLFAHHQLAPQRAAARQLRNYRGEHRGAAIL